MKVENTVIFMGNESRTAAAEAAKEDRTGKKSIFAGDFGKTMDPIEQKRQQAQKKAMKIVGDAWDSDRKMDAQLEKMRGRIREYRDTMNAAGDKLSQIEAQRTELQKTCGVSEDSQEQKDLELLVKREKAGKPESGVTLTEEEQEALARIDEAGLTEYQERSLGLYKSREAYESESYAAQQAMKAENSALTTMKIDLLKNHGMLDAQKASDEILEAASDEIIGMLIEEAKDKIDEEMEEKKEAAEEKAEEKEAEEERAEKADEKEAQQEEITDQIGDSSKKLLQAEDAMSDVQKEIQKLMEEMKLVEEDLKGAAVDTIG